MREGDILTVTIERLGVQGDGLAMAENRPLYVPLVLPGEVVSVKLVRMLGEGYQTEVQEIITPSPDRLTPPCPHFTQCGGCLMQHLAEAPYLAWKVGVVKGALKQHGLNDIEVRPTLSVPSGSRRRLTLAAFARKNAEPLIGFNARSSHQLVNIEACPIARPELIRLLPLLRLTLAPWINAAKSLDISLTLTSSGVDILITGNEPDLAAREATALMMREPSIARVSWRKAERTRPEPMLVDRQPVVSFGGIPVSLPAGAFLQPSVEGEKILVKTVQTALNGVKGRIADLFAGCGSFSFQLASFGDVVALEGDEAAVHALASATHFQKGVKAERRDLFRDPLDADDLNEFTAVVFDPPRAGASAQCVQLAKSKVQVIVGVSCNPGTFARDAETLVKGGYKLDWVQPVDQFLWSNHVELVARFSR